MCEVFTFKADLRKRCLAGWLPTGWVCQDRPGLSLADAVHHRVIHVPLEPDTRELPGHPGIKRIVQEQIGEHGRNRGPL